MNSSNMPEKLSKPVIPANRQLKANRFARTSRLLSFFKAVLFAALLIWLILGGFSAQILGYIDLPLIPAAVVFALILIVVYGVLSTPVGFYKGFILARRYGLSTRSFVSWLAAYLQSGFLLSILVISVIAAAYWAISFLPDLWWLVVWGILIVISFILNLLLPGVLIPMFYKTKALDDEDLKRRFYTLAKKAGVHIKGFYIIEFSSKQTTANAALVGIGRSKRVLLSDTLLADYSIEEIEAVIAHELGHLKNRDGAGVFLFQALILFASLWITAVVCGTLSEPPGFSGIGDVAMLPLMILVFASVNMVFTPVSNAVMRSFETAADDFAIRLTVNPPAFISMITKLTQQNLGEVNPPLWVEFLLYDHPGYYRRLSYARRFMRSSIENDK
ncbi:MAG: M48 family metallopeptidase [Dehalococcoidales bacterium]|nr:M48 family metallopeptidase [Dehalococcoidales bacterium]